MSIYKVHIFGFDIKELFGRSGKNSLVTVTAIFVGVIMYYAWQTERTIFIWVIFVTMQISRDNTNNSS
jgi:hypothetical protein